MNYNKTPEALIEKWKAETEETLANAASLNAAAERQLAEARLTDAKADEFEVMNEIAKQKQADAHEWNCYSQLFVNCLLFILVIYSAVYTLKTFNEWFKQDTPKPAIQIVNQSPSNVWCHFTSENTVTCKPI